MEKKLITEMKFMLERLENPRMTYTEYEKKHNQLIKEDEDGKESEKPMMPKKPSTKGQGLPEKPSKKSPFLKAKVEPELPELKEDEEDNKRDYDYILGELGKYGLHPNSGWFEEFENSTFYDPEMSDEEYADVIYDFIINGDNEY